MYVLMPTTYIWFENECVYVGNIMRKNSEIKFEKIEDIVPNKTTLEKEIFVEASQICEFKNLYFRKLEKKYNGMVSRIGYIETTSVCPYHCKACPKYTHDIIRDNKTMDEKCFGKLSSQLNGQNEVELHLFGDPFCDKEIYRRIEILNKNGIIPSFSTNLISIININWNKLSSLKIGRLTISCDTDDYEIFSRIRGNISEEKLQECYFLIEKLADFAQKTDCIDVILLQKIRMHSTYHTGRSIQRIAELHEKCTYVEKEYIEFPNEKRTGLGKPVEYKGNERVWLYHLLGKKTPFKCLKVWDKKEQAVTSDGNIVPCCLSYNAVAGLGNLNEQTLIQIQESEIYKVFRKNIWDGISTNSICDICFQDKQVLYHTKVDKLSIQKLQTFCIESW